MAENAQSPMIISLIGDFIEDDSKYVVEGRNTCTGTDQDKLISNLKTIQDYLCSFEAQGLTIVNISATTFPQTLDWLHGYLLQCIEHGVSAATPNIGNPSKVELGSKSE
ncbi:uncharacterized protein A4U43_C03F31070 [Asparagus officinalis]|uniref:Uncharacterized protein n=1 Tax=Asparagus officinalis TaxID=4686 RepID=A0A5P1FIG3_ASPOF|nr:uncharacterized protein A4U43_C03F31070 [Asparagus officinalis]